MKELDENPYIKFIKKITCFNLFFVDSTLLHNFLDLYTTFILI